ncbi:hypothetical protein V1514DRAFT_49682 [Lipomyces japonicus]|uniref:uncharacterized protein n=1 Tax=Lipomyces japonicus TaxID=56871 RepID=UPI0034CD2869
MTNDNNAHVDVRDVEKHAQHDESESVLTRELRRMTLQHLRNISVEVRPPAIVTAAASVVAVPEPARVRYNRNDSNVTTITRQLQRQQDREKVECMIRPRLFTHILGPLAALAVMFVGWGAAIVCLYLLCLGETVTAADTAYLWRGWSRWVCGFASDYAVEAVEAADGDGDGDDVH